MNLRQYAQDVRQIAERMATRHPSGFLYVTSLFNRDKTTVDGVVTEVSTQLAGKLLHELTHRESTPEEIQEFHRKNQAAKELILRGRDARYPKPLAVTVEQRR